MFVVRSNYNNYTSSFVMDCTEPRNDFINERYDFQAKGNKPFL